MDDEKYKELMYDIGRVTTQAAHDLIIKYAENQNAKTTGDNIICIKDVIMDGSGKREFTKGKTYKLIKSKFSPKFTTINDSQAYHGISMNMWFHDHFDFI